MRLLLRLIVAVVAVALLVPTAPAYAADTSAPTLVEIQLGQSSVAVSGLNVVGVAVRVHLTDDTGVVTTARSGTQPATPQIRLTLGGGWPYDTLPAWQEAVPPLTLVQGSATDGWWAGTLLVTSQWNGTWTTQRVEAYDASGNHLFDQPELDGKAQSLTVIGQHIPRLSMGFTPSPAPYGQSVTMKGRLTYSDTGAPLPGQPLTIGLGPSLARIAPASIACFATESGLLGGTASTTTDANGYYRYVVPPAYVSGGARECIGFGPTSGNGAVDLFTSPLWAGAERLALHLWGISGVPTSHTVLLGGSVDVNGTLRPFEPYWVEYTQLQRLVSGQWRTVNSARVRASGRYTLVATPPTCGNHRYRVYDTMDAGSGFAPTSTTPFLIGVPCG